MVIVLQWTKDKIKKESKDIQDYGMLVDLTTTSKTSGINISGHIHVCEFVCVCLYIIV